MLQLSSYSPRQGAGGLSSRRDDPIYARSLEFISTSNVEKAYFLFLSWKEVYRTLAKLRHTFCPSVSATYWSKLEVATSPPICRTRARGNKTEMVELILHSCPCISSKLTA